MYWKRSADDLSQAEYEAGQLGFLGCLRRKRFAPQFIERNADDLFQQACFEYSRKVKEGEEIDNPPGWLIECAWRRTMSRLEAERSGPRFVSTEKIEPLPDETAAGPEDLLLNAERWRKVRKAVAELSPDQRRVLMVSYFEGLPVREAARRLRWHPSKAQRAHERARERLHDLLGVESSDDLTLEIGLAAYISLAAEPSTGALQRAAESLASLRQQLADSGAQLKEQAVTGYYRAVDPTPLAAARPGTVAAMVASCVAIGGGAATYCVEQGMNPVGAARGLIASSDEPEPLPSSEPTEAPPAPVYTPAGPPPESEQPEPEPSAPPAEEAPEPSPKPEAPAPPAPPAPDESFEPVAQPSTEVEEPVETYEEPEPAPAESSRPAPVATPSSGGFEP